ncbi:MAG: hypothetical protein ACTHN4_09240 [Sphingomicrobium sp.]
MTTTSRDFWMSRLGEALDKAVGAPTEDSRLAYLKLARHYCAMQERSNRRSGQSSASGSDPIFSAATQAWRHDFHSVHDALMQAA